MVDVNGQILSGQVFRYDAYGNRLDAATALTSLLYSGELTDSTGLQYLRARYYDPASGTFNRLDPFAGNMQDPLSLHKYLYVHADPVQGIDPSGKFVGTAVGVLGGMAGLTIARMRHNAVVTSAGFSAMAFLKNVVGYGCFTYAGYLSASGGYFAAMGILFNPTSGGPTDASMIARHLKGVLQARFDHHEISDAELASGSMAAERIARAYVEVVDANKGSHGAWIGNTFGLGNRCTEWVMRLESDRRLKAAVSGTQWGLRSHYNVPKWGWSEDFVFLPHSDPETGNWELWLPIHPLHSFLTLTFKDTKDPVTGKYPFPDLVLDPWRTNSPEVYDPVKFHRTWPLNYGHNSGITAP
ncbi:MAG: RHS repeat-associated core domain-containing protein [Planctomycetaceae bacterium]|nr:RHS repeat-associated core domain-containing protein [Planctomycetaceae bacterium]